MRAYNNPLISLISLIIIALSLNLAHAQDPEAWEEQDTTLVGRISHLEGQLSRYNPDTDDWEITTKEAPFGLDDLLYAEADVKAEFIMPNNTWIRIGGDTRLQLVSLKSETTELDIAFGKARLYNKSAKAQINATTPFGHINAPPGATVDLSVTENGVEIIAVKKNVYFIHNTSSARHEIRSNSSAIFADINEVTTAPGEVEYSWKKFNQEMDALWATRMRDKGASAAHLPPELRTEAYPLDRHGVWERVYYEGNHYRFWRPVQVSATWAPFTSGAWTVWHGDHVWIPHEPFGYVTHHYGNWIFTAGFWYWAPPITRVMIHSHVSHLRIGFGWYPGRVAWIHHGAHVGWIPLAPREPYYSHRHWGRRSIVVTSGTRYHHRSHRYRHHKHAVVIHRSHLYRSGNYNRARIKSLSHDTIRHKFRTTPVLKTAVIKDHGSMRKAKNRYKPAHRAHLSNRSVKSLNANQRGRLSKDTPRQRRQSPHEKVKVGSQRKKIQPGRTTVDKKQRFSGKSNPNAFRSDTKNQQKRSTTSNEYRGRSDGHPSRATRKTSVHRNRENIKREVEIAPGKTNRKKPHSGRTDVDKKKAPKTKPEPLRTNRTKEKRSVKKETAKSPHRDKMRSNARKYRDNRNKSKIERTNRNTRSQNKPTKGQFAPANSNKQRHGYQRSVHGNPKPTRAGKAASYNRQPASRDDRFVRRVERRNQPAQRQNLQQPNHQSQSSRKKGFSSPRHRQSTSGQSRNRNRN